QILPETLKAHPRRWLYGRLILEAPPSLRTLQARLSLRALLVVLGLCFALVLRDQSQGVPLLALPWVAGVGLLGILLLRRWPGLRPWVGLALGLAAVACIYRDGLFQRYAAPPSSLFLVLACPLLVLATDTWVGVALGLAAVVQWKLLAHAFPPPDERTTRLLENCFVLTPSLLATAWFFQRAFARLGTDLEQRWQELTRRNDQNLALGHQVFDEFKSPLSDLGTALEAAPGGAPGWEAPLESLNHGVDAARRLARTLDLPEPASAGPDAFEAARLGFLRFSVWWFAVTMAIPVAGSFWRGQVNQMTYWNGLIAVILVACGIWKSRPSYTAWLLLIPTLLEAIPGLRFWAPPGQAPGLIAMPAMVIIGGFWDGKRMAWTAAVAATALITLDASWALSDPMRLEQDFDALACAWMAWFTVGQALGLHAALIRHRQAVLEALERGLAGRQRLLGVLFHDLANPLGVISLRLQGGHAGGAGERQQILGQVRRLQGLLEAARPFVLEQGELPPARRRPLYLEPLLAELPLQFQQRLELKDQRLQWRCQPGLAVATVPELLSGCVLSNLVSNAIKFSPRGATIQVEAQAKGGTAELWVLDSGPGFPAAVLSDRLRVRRYVSSPGSLGEPGQGLGLGLASDYLSRLGGSLELDNAAQGGARARVLLPLVQPVAEAVPAH
ncbi:MAG TPA: HAMP domain-containing sensor histidine kinase, partial [bacterium]|nr:HAMP domain-containing sensor histidine kinase [bacterium]